MITLIAKIAFALFMLAIPAWAVSDLNEELPREGEE